MSTPIPYYLSDPDYYNRKDSNYISHIGNIIYNNTINRLITMASVDGSYSILVGRQKDKES